MRLPSRILLGVAIAIHVTMLISWRTGILNPLFFDATVTHGRRGWDFYALYQAGHNVLTGHSVYESDGNQIDVIIPDGAYTPFRYLPLSGYTLGVALNLLPPLWAYRLWVVVIELCLIGCVWLTWRIVEDPDRRARLTAMWLCFSPYYLELYMGQFSFVQGGLVFLMLVLSLRRQPGPGFDLAWTASVLWKQNTALFLPAMVRLRRWRALGLLALALVVTAGPYFVLQPGSLQAFLANFSSPPPWFQLGNLGFRQLVFDAMWSAADALRIELPTTLYVAAQRTVVGGFLLFSLALLALDRQLDVVRHVSLWMVGYFVLYHHVWEHHYVMLLPVLVTLAIREESPWLWLLYLLLALPTPFHLIDPGGQVAMLDAMRWTPIRPLWQDLAYHASKAVPALLLYGTLAWQIARSAVRDWRGGQFYLWPVSSGGEAGSQVGARL